MNRLFVIGSMLPVILAYSCNSPFASNKEMVETLASIFRKNEVPTNVFSSMAKLNYFDSLNQSPRYRKDLSVQFYLAHAYLESGIEEKSLALYNELLQKLRPTDRENRNYILKEMAIAWMRYGERKNCITNHSAGSCIFPIKKDGVHKDPTGSEKAIDIYLQLLENDSLDLESRWLLNIAYMTIDKYPRSVPKKYLLEFPSTSTVKINPFVDVAMNTGLNTNNLAGGSIVEDFNNDGFLDVITSSMNLKQGMHYCISNGDGTFTDVSEKSGLKMLTGGLNAMQTDYNNDGWKDVFVTRGGWKQEYGREPNSLLRNNGDGTFTDVTVESGLLSFNPTQTATWADFNNDGWLDLFIGNEPISKFDRSHSEFYINQKNGRFKQAAHETKVLINEYVKGVNSGDYNNDGLVDLFISTFTGKKMLFKNIGNKKDGMPVFENVSEKSGVARNRQPSFSTWFFDYDNDGWQDIVACGYRFDRPLAVYAAAEAIGNRIPEAGNVILFRNKHDGTFEEISEQCGLNKVAFAMGSNFGDIDNDGYLDFYLGTGNPDYSSLIPNKLFRNNNGKFFEDITSVARVGNLQKGHGVSFADIDNDGDEDIYMDLGGAYEGDGYQNPLYLNPGQNNNKWVKLSLTGVKANKAAIGARVKLTFRDNNNLRSVYRVICTGSSFGANPLTQHVGIGEAEKIDVLEIKWPGTNKVQSFHNLPVNKILSFVEGRAGHHETEVKKFNLLAPKGFNAIGCAPGS